MRRRTLYVDWSFLLFFICHLLVHVLHLNFNKQLYGQTHPNHANQHVHDYEQQFVLLAIQLLLATRSIKVEVHLSLEVPPKNK